MGKSVLLAMSGGIDSSAAAVLLTEAGYQVNGITFRIEGVNSYAVENAENICRKLSIPHEYIDVTERFSRNVIDYFKCEYGRGRTPNPCIRCNSTIKFGYLFDLAMERGFDYIATGHYATITKDGNGFYLEKSIDETRDQTYFLYILKESHLKKTLFPLNGIPKDKARRICSDAGLIPYDSDESREICFVPGDYRDYLEERGDVSIIKGKFIDEKGSVIGTHEGLYKYTLGQRKGLGLNEGRPLFITNMDPVSGNISVGDEKDLYTKDLTIEKVNLINDRLPQNGTFYVKIRYGSNDHEAETLEGPEDGSIRIRLTEPARAVTPGQSAVIYAGRRVLGGGIIK